MGGLSINKALSRCYKAACGLLRRLCHGGRCDFCSGGQKFSTIRAPPIGLWLLEEESGGVEWSRAMEDRATGGRASASRR